MKLTVGAGRGGKGKLWISMLLQPCRQHQGFINTQRGRAAVFSEPWSGL